MSNSPIQGLTPSSAMGETSKTRTSAGIPEYSRRLGDAASLGSETCGLGINFIKKPSCYTMNFACLAFYELEELDLMGPREWLAGGLKTQGKIDEAGSVGYFSHIYKRA